MELAPQYYLSNLPPSESRDLLMELREKVAAAAEEEEEEENMPAVPEDLEESPAGVYEVCVLQ